MRKGINHNIDELLVGTFTQISLKMKQNWVKDDSFNKVQNILIEVELKVKSLFYRYKTFLGTCLRWLAMENPAVTLLFYEVN